ncbi:MAG: hypothetical protein KJO21_10650 [Verrucomicrobiae bacterium]|nr:hypothetical protein [Verrucomicrobiae bacterium]NNJ42743.1 hypothetical protein [Akkermansiaceae bacterium]
MEEKSDHTLPGGSALPDLQQSVLDPETLDQLFVDLASLTEITEIIPKAAAQGYVPEHTEITLEASRELLLAGHVRGLQIRYNYQGSQWWDTLLPAPGNQGFRIVRIQHDFD